MRFNIAMTVPKLIIQSLTMKLLLFFCLFAFELGLIQNFIRIQKNYKQPLLTYKHKYRINE